MYTQYPWVKLRCSASITLMAYCIRGVTEPGEIMDPESLHR